MNIGEKKVNSDLNEIGEGINNYYNKAKNYLNDLVNYPIIIGSILILIILLKK